MLSKWINDLNVKSEMLITVEENIGSNPQDIYVGKDFLNKNPFPQELRPTVYKWSLIRTNLPVYLKKKSIK